MKSIKVFFTVFLEMVLVLFPLLGQGQMRWADMSELFTAVHFPSANIGFVVTSSGRILKTVDTGENWSKIYQSKRSLSGVLFVSSTTGWVVGDSGTVMKTTNGGSTWLSQSIATSTYLSLLFRDFLQGIPDANKADLPSAAMPDERANFYL